MIGPGKYALTAALHVNPYVSISGAGEESTELFMVTPNQPTLILPDGLGVSAISFDNLTVRNSVPGQQPVPILVMVYQEQILVTLVLLRQGAVSLILLLEARVVLVSLNTSRYALLEEGGLLGLVVAAFQVIFLCKI